MNATSVAVTSTLLARRNCRRSTAAAAAAAVIDVDSAARYRDALWSCGMQQWWGQVNIYPMTQVKVKSTCTCVINLRETPERGVQNPR